MNYKEYKRIQRNVKIDQFLKGMLVAFITMVLVFAAICVHIN